MGTLRAYEMTCEICEWRYNISRHDDPRQSRHLKLRAWRQTQEHLLIVSPLSDLDTFYYASLAGINIYCKYNTLFLVILHISLVNENELKWVRNGSEFNDRISWIILFFFFFSFLYHTSSPRPYLYILFNFAQHFWAQT